MTNTSAATKAAEAERHQRAACSPSDDMSDGQVTHRWQDIVDDEDRHDRDVGVHGARAFRGSVPAAGSRATEPGEEDLREPEQGPWLVAESTNVRWDSGVCLPYTNSRQCQA